MCLIGLLIDVTIVCQKRCRLLLYFSQISLITKPKRHTFYWQCLNISGSFPLCADDIWPAYEDNLILGETYQILCRYDRNIHIWRFKPIFISVHALQVYCPKWKLVAQINMAGQPNNQNTITFPFHRHGEINCSQHHASPNTCSW